MTNMENRVIQRGEVSEVLKGEREKLDFGDVGLDQTGELRRE